MDKGADTTAANNDVNLNTNRHGSHLLLDISPGITLEEPSLEQMRHERQERTRATMEAVDPRLTREVLPKIDNLNPEGQAAVRIQALYRGHLGRKQYLQKLLEQFEKEEAMRLEKTRAQVEEGELLVENHKLQVQLDDNATTRRNKSRLYNTHVITIQRAWRAYKRQQDHDPGTPNNNMSPQLSETEELSETESANGAQAMSVSTPEDSDKNLNAEDEIQSDFDSTTNVEAEEDLVDFEPETRHNVGADDCVVPPGGKWIEPEPDSVVSDYSEMADPLKEHLANVQIIQKEDLDVGNTMFPNHFSVGQKIIRSPDETEEEFTKRLRKINYLSLAQEFAALKKKDADALPFDLHKGAQDLPNLRDFSPMSETSSETDLTDSSTTTPMEVVTTEFAVPPPRAAPMASVKTSKLSERFERAINPKEAWSQESSLHKPKSVSSEVKPEPRSEVKVRVNDKDEPDFESQPLSKSTTTTRSGEERKVSPGLEKLGDFDVYNIESTLPQLDWSTLEEQLQKAAEEERQKQRSRRNDREEIRRKLAMGLEEEYYGGERMYKKPNLQTRLQSGMNLQICFMNEATSDVDSVNGDGEDVSSQKSSNKDPALEVSSLDKASPLRDKPKLTTTEETVYPPRTEGKTEGKDGEEDEDFFAKQAKLQDEARMALAQVRPMAHMQLEVEKQMRKKSPIAEMVGMPALAAKKKLGRYHLSEMNVAQLQVVVNDLHSQIETLNEELVILLVGRDDLHMEQDSMLVDIEDHHRRALEVAAKMNKPKRANKNIKK